MPFSVVCKFDRSNVKVKEEKQTNSLQSINEKPNEEPTQITRKLKSLDLNKNIDSQSKKSFENKTVKYQSSINLKVSENFKTLESNYCFETNPLIFDKANNQSCTNNNSLLLENSNFYNNNKYCFNSMIDCLNQNYSNLGLQKNEKCLDVKLLPNICENNFFRCFGCEKIFLNPNDEDQSNDFPKHSTQISSETFFYQSDLDQLKLEITRVLYDIFSLPKNQFVIYNSLMTSHELGLIEKCNWVGYISISGDKNVLMEDTIKKSITDSLSKNCDSNIILITEKTFDIFYNNFCKNKLLRILQYEIPDDKKVCVYNNESWNEYKYVNQMYSDEAVKQYLKEDPSQNDDKNIWIYNYHLMLVPSMIRKKLPSAKIGFFFLVSFPSYEIFSCLEKRDELLTGMLGANFITFQTEEYLNNFKETCYKILSTKYNELGVFYEDRFIFTKCFSTGVSLQWIHTHLNLEIVKKFKKSILDKWKSSKLIVSSSNMDSTSGVKQKLLGFEKFLLENPKRMSDVKMIILSKKKNINKSYLNEILYIVNRINSYSTNIINNLRVVVITNEISYVHYLSLLSCADVFIVASSRAGLNLSCHEFIVASQEKKSPLILSEFTGSASLLELNNNGALIINPWDTSSISEKISLALNMSSDEKLSRWKNCYNVVVQNDSISWTKKACDLALKAV